MLETIGCRTGVDLGSWDASRVLAQNQNVTFAQPHLKAECLRGKYRRLWSGVRELGAWCLMLWRFAGEDTEVRGECGEMCG